MLRSGSTYLFARLRELDGLYCYYEPMHELVAWAAADVTRLDIETHADKMEQLRHPEMQSPYFDELRQSASLAESPRARCGVWRVFCREPC